MTDERQPDDELLDGEPEPPRRDEEFEEHDPLDDQPPPARVEPVVVPRWVQLVTLPLAIVALWIVAFWAARSFDARGGNAKTLTLHADMQAGDVVVYRFSGKP